VLQTLLGVERLINAVLSDLEPARLAATDAAAVFEAATRLESKVGALRLLVSARATEAGTWRTEGHRSAAHWVAEKMKGSLKDAHDSLATAERLEWLPDVEESLRAGALSVEQTRHVAEAATEVPGAVPALLHAARAQNLAELEASCRATRLRGASRKDGAEAQARIQRRRRLWHATGADGSFRFGGETTAADGARWLAAVEARQAEVFARARAEGRREAPGAYALDALVELVTGAQGGAPAPRGANTTVTILVSDEALRRGQVEEGERCEVPGLGAVPLAMVEQVVGDARLELVVTRGVDVASVCSLGRTVPRAMAQALRARDPVCVAPGCASAHGLETHHWLVPFARERRTTLGGICRICSFHHDLVTYAGWDLVGGPGQWRLLRPDDPDNRGHLDSAEAGPGDRVSRASPQGPAPPEVEGRPNRRAAAQPQGSSVVTDDPELPLFADA
jgi:Domain of unknown function (DUF222)